MRAMHTYGLAAKNNYACCDNHRHHHTLDADRQNQRRQHHQTNEDPLFARILYIAPLPDLLSERLAGCTIRFVQGLGKVVVKLTGETAPDLRLLAKANIVFDELHLIGGERGPVLTIWELHHDHSDASFRDT
jgi:hypothetical protein